MMHAAHAPEPKTLEARSRKQWDEAAKGWNDHTPHIRAWLRDATQAMLDVAAVRRGSAVLDVAAGAGDQTLAIAERVGPEGRVLATDFSPEILRFARNNAEQAGYANVGTQLADAGRLPLQDASFDAAVCRLGLMLFSDPLQSLREMLRVLRPGGRACTLVFSAPEANPCISTLLATALEHARLGARDPYQPGGLLSLGKPGRVDELFRAAGFHDVATIRMDAPFRLPSAAHYLAFVRASASPIQQILSGLDAAAAAVAWDDMKRRLQRFDTEEGWAGPNELLLTVGRR